MKTKRRREDSPQRGTQRKCYKTKRRRQCPIGPDTLKIRHEQTEEENFQQIIRSIPFVPYHLEMSNCYGINKQHMNTLKNSWFAQLISISLEFCTSLTDADVASLTGFEPTTDNTTIVLEPVDVSECKLESLNLAYTNLGDAGLVTLILACPNLKHINLKHTRITDWTLSLIAQHCRHIQTLDVSGCDVGSYGIQLVAQECKDNLHCLEMNDCPRVNVAVIPYLCFHCPT